MEVESVEALRAHVRQNDLADWLERQFRDLLALA